MKRMNIIRLICLSCFLYVASSTASAQDLKSILSGVANAVANKVTTSSGVSLEGTWKYTAPDCKFESDNFLAQAGGEIASKKWKIKCRMYFPNLVLPTDVRTFSKPIVRILRL